MKKLDDLFGQALYDHHKGQKTPFYIEVRGERREHNIDRYFDRLKNYLGRKKD